jgi:hypothetical protein
MDTKVLLARIISFIAFVVGGGGIQLALWFKNGRGFFESLIHWPFLWAIYLLGALLIGEHALKFMKRSDR